MTQQLSLHASGLGNQPCIGTQPAYYKNKTIQTNYDENYIKKIYTIYNEKNTSRHTLQDPLGIDFFAAVSIASFRILTLCSMFSVRKSLESSRFVRLQPALL